MHQTTEYLQLLFKRWRRLASVECLLYGLALSLPIAGLLHLLSGAGWPVLLGAGLAFTFIIAILFAQLRGWLQASVADLTHYLNRTYPELENSADLLLRQDAELAPLARRQRRRVEQNLERIDIRLPHQLPRAIGAVLVAALFTWGVVQLPVRADGPAAGIERAAPAIVDGADSTKAGVPIPPPVLRQASIRIRPPAYTRLPVATSTDLHIEAPAGAAISWSLAFEPSVAEGRLATGDGRELPLRPGEDGDQSVRLQLQQSTFYTLHFSGADGAWQTSDYYRLEALPDQPPRVEVSGLPEYAEYPYSEDKRIAFQATVSDDYGISAARLIATVSSGEGESVKFRDDTLYFNASFRRQAKQYELQKNLRLAELSMKPGDELYLHLEALDNRQPDPQITKTFKYIIAFEHPDALTMDMTGGLAVDRLPEYFRSQRQIIIDTEKLIARKAALDAAALLEASNNIASDQKLLRLRYGRFLGEEFQTVIGEATAAVDDHEGEDAAVKEGEHEHEHEHDDHDHDHDHSREPAAQSPEAGPVAELEPYYHTHDLTEEVTFFDATTTAKLRIALTQMWDAELHLRLGRPRQALPFEYRALKLIKEIQQASRIYVERVGFEAPAINVAEKRLTGELDDIASPKLQRDIPAGPPYPAIAAAVPILESLQGRQGPPDRREYARLQAGGEELAALAVDQPGAYLLALQQLRALMENEVAPAQRRQYLRELQRVFWSLLPDKAAIPQRLEDRKGELGKLYLQELQRE